MIARVPGSKLALAAAAAFLAALLALAFFSSRPAWYLLPDSDRPLAERALRRGAAEFGLTTESYRRETRPRITRLRDRTCVYLATAARDHAGSYFTCFNRHTGKILEERVIIGF